MISKEEFREIEKQYNVWLSKHPKGDHNYKSFSHMRRSIEFAKHYHHEQVENLTTPSVVQQSELFTCKQDGGTDNCGFKHKDYMTCVHLRKCPFAEE